MFKDNVEVLIYSLMGAGAQVHYTIDGTEPTNKSTAFSTKINFQKVGDYVVKACVSAPERRDSVVVEQHYHVRTESAAPTIRASVLDPENPEAANTTTNPNSITNCFKLILFTSPIVLPTIGTLAIEESSTSSSVVSVAIREGRRSFKDSSLSQQIAAHISLIELI